MCKIQTLGCNRIASAMAPTSSRTETQVIYPVKTLSQLPLMLKGFRKGKGLTQTALAELLGITQQSYAYLEANPATATLERLFKILRLLDVEISLEQLSAVPAPETQPKRKISKPSRATSAGAKARSGVKAPRVPARKKESW
jgi:HTH-type transcriptional regulator/antitoxin HipB